MATNQLFIWLSIISFKRSPLAAGVGIAMGTVGAFGFDPSMKDASQGVDEMGRVALLMPGAIAIFGIVMLYSYPLTARRHAIARRWITRKLVVKLDS